MSKRIVETRREKGKIPYETGAMHFSRRGSERARRARESASRGFPGAPAIPARKPEALVADLYPPECEAAAPFDQAPARLDPERHRERWTETRVHPSSVFFPLEREEEAPRRVEVLLRVDPANSAGLQIRHGCQENSAAG